MNRQAIFSYINVERDFQDDKWGEQNHNDEKWLAILTEEIGEVSKAILEGNLEETKAELVQSAAVIVAWFEAIQRRELYR